MTAELSLCLLLVAATHTATYGLQIGTLPNLQHGVSGTLHVDNDVTIRIENFRYDGLGPTVFLYYYGHGVTVDRNGGGTKIPVPASIGGQSDGRFEPGRSFNGQTIVFTMPSGTTVRDIGTFTIWCERFTAIFTRLEFPANIVIPDGGGGGGGGDDKPKNCVPLSNQLQLSWTINTTVSKPMATFTLCGCLLTDGYMSFGLSGAVDSINMVNGDVTVAWVDNQPHAEDYYLQRREQCRGGIGVCPDSAATNSVGSTCKEDNFDVSGSVSNGVTCVTYSRYLDTGDTDCDSVFDMSRLQNTYAIWALGPRGTTAFQHFSRSGASTQPLNLTRDIVDECTTAPRCTNCAGFTPSSITAMKGTTFTAEIGASGGAQGYKSITGQPGWGIAWYINEQLIPELTLMRGENYTFRVFGGNNASTANRASYHPFYITDSSSGGRLLSTPDQRTQETVFAGFDDNEPTGVGTLCEFNEGSGSEAIRQQCGTIGQYRDSLVKVCKQSPAVPAEVMFSPNETTPNVVYYQCATHINLGWRINVVPTISAGSVFIQSWIVMLLALTGVMLLG